MKRIAITVVEGLFLSRDLNHRILLVAETVAPMHRESHLVSEDLELAV